MARGPCTFRKRDLTAAVKAVVAAGVQVTGVEVTKDGFRLETASTSLEPVAEITRRANPWDNV